jgi:penicillin-binding protein 1A
MMMTTSALRDRLRALPLQLSVGAAILVIASIVLFTALVVYLRMISPLSLENIHEINRQPTIVVYDRNDRPLASRLAPGPRVTELLRKASAGDPGARNVVDAVVAVEDRRFWNRSPFDILAMAKAVVWDARGASTIPMQLIKNVYWTSDPDNPSRKADGGLSLIPGPRRYVRKLQEVIFAPDVENELTKEQVLGVYLRVAPDYGSKVKGIERVSLFFFGVYPEFLSAAQAASLAATLKAPEGYDPRRIGVPERLPSDNVDRLGRPIYSANGPLRSPADCEINGKRVLNNRCRTLVILAEMRRQTEQGPGAIAGQTMLNEQEYQQAVREALTMGTCDTPPKMAQQRQMGLLPPDEAICQRTPRQYIGMAIDHVESMGLHSRPGSLMQIYSNFDPTHHRALVDVVEALRKCRFSPDTFGLTSVGRDGAVLTSLESPYFGTDSGQPDEPRRGIPPGSTLKPFIYSAWLTLNPELGPNPIVTDSAQPPAAAFNPQAWVSRRRGVPWWPNANDPERRPELRVALAQSYNRPITWVGATMGPGPVARAFSAVGINFYGQSGSRGPTPPHGFPRAVDQKWSMALMGEGGAAQVLPIQLISAYAMFANGGRAVSPQLVRHVRYFDEQDIRTDIQTPSARTGGQVFSAQAVAAVDTAMADVVTRGTAAGLGLERYGVHGKTGTVSDNRYGWFIGYPASRDFVTGAWIYSPKVTARRADKDFTRYLDVKSRDAARIHAAFLRRLFNGDFGASQILPEDVCPTESQNLDQFLQQRLGKPA